MLSRYFFAKRELKNLDFDIVHLNSSQITDWLAPSKAKGKVIMHVRESLSIGTFGIRYSFFKRQMQKYTDKIIAISYDNARRIGLPNKTEVIYNFSDIVNENIDDESYCSNKVLYLGGTQKIKGFYLLVESLDYLASDIKVYFGGEYTGNDNNSFKLKIKKIIGYDRKKRMAINKMRQNPRTIEIGLVYDVTKYFNETCCLVSPYTTSHFARPVIEAYLHKKPAIGTDVDGMNEIIEHNKTGLLVKKNDGKALAEAINYLTKNSIKAKEMGEYAYSIALKKFTNRNIEQIMKIYSELI
jgi:glycosyltransferase involved in cell wall biosynthesis